MGTSYKVGALNSTYRGYIYNSSYPFILGHLMGGAHNSSYNDLARDPLIWKGCFLSDETRNTTWISNDLNWSPKKKGK